MKPSLSFMLFLIRPVLYQLMLELVECRFRSYDDVTMKIPGLKQFHDEVHIPDKDIDVCKYNMDLLFLLDASGSISPPDFERQLVFAMKIMESLNIADGSTHVAVKLFAKRMHSAWCFSEYMTKDSLINATSYLACKKCRKGFTSSGLALKEALEKVFVPQCGVRRQDVVPRVVIIVTDAKSTETPKHGYPRGWVAEQGRKLHQAGVHVIAVGVGKHLTPESGHEDYEELKLIADSEDRIFTTSSFSGLLDILENVTKSTCETATIGPKPYIRKPRLTTSDCADDNQQSFNLILLLDASGSIDEADWDVQIYFVLKLFESLLQAGLTPAVSLSVISRHVTHVFGFSQHNQTAAGIKEIMEQLKDFECQDCRDGKTAIGKALQITRERTLNEENGYSKDSVSLVLLLTDAKSTEVEDYWIEQAARLHDMGLHVAAVAVGDYREPNLRYLASEPKLVFHVFQMDALLAALSPLLAKLCGVYLPPHCEEGWSYDVITGKCAKFFDTEIRGILVGKACDLFEAKPARVRNAADAYYLREISTNFTWIHLRQNDKTDTWHWGRNSKRDENQLTYVDWKTGHPRRPRGLGRMVTLCGLMNDNQRRKWESHGCNRKAYYICVKDALPRTTGENGTTAGPDAGTGDSSGGGTRTGIIGGATGVPARNQRWKRNKRLGGSKVNSTTRLTADIVDEDPVGDNSGGVNSSFDDELLYTESNSGQFKKVLGNINVSNQSGFTVIDTSNFLLNKTYNTSSKAEQISSRGTMEPNISQANNAEINRVGAFTDKDLITKNESANISILVPPMVDKAHKNNLVSTSKISKDNEKVKGNGTLT